MHKQITPNMYQSARGFTLEVCGMTGLRYEESGRTIDINAEVTLGPEGLIVYESSIQQWIGPSGSQMVTEDDRRRIVSWIKELFLERGYEILVVHSGA